METTNGIDYFGDESPRNNNDNDRFLTFVDDRIFGRVDDLRIREFEE